MPSAIKLSDAMVSLAREESESMGRSIASQVEYWARLGRAVERAPGFGYERVRAMLAGRARFDDLTADEQSVALVELEDYLENLPRDRDAVFFAALRQARVPVYGEPSTRSVARRAIARNPAKRRRA